MPCCIDRLRFSLRFPISLFFFFFYPAADLSVLNILIIGWWSYDDVYSPSVKKKLIPRVRPAVCLHVDSFKKCSNGSDYKFPDSTIISNQDFRIEFR